MFSWIKRWMDEGRLASSWDNGVPAGSWVDFSLEG